MGNQLTKLRYGKIIKKENVTEQQLIEKLYKYEKIGTVGKIKSLIENSEQREQQMYLQFGFASSKVDYLEEKLNDYEKENEELRKNINLSYKFRKINEGLKKECTRYKKIIEDNEKVIEKYSKIRKFIKELFSQIRIDGEDVYDGDTYCYTGYIIEDVDFNTFEISNELFNILDSLKELVGDSND